MRFGSGRFIVAALVAATAAGCAANGSGASAPRSDLSGTWVPRAGGAASAQATSASGEDGVDRMIARDTGRRGRAGSGMGRERGGERGDFGEMGEMGYANSSFAALRRSEQRFTIQQSDTLVHISYADRSYFDLRPNGKKHADIWRGIGRIEIRADWKDGALEVTRYMEDGTTIHEAYSRAPGSPDLVITTRVDSQRGKGPEIRRVFQQAAGE